MGKTFENELKKPKITYRLNVSRLILLEFR